MDTKAKNGDLGRTAAGLLAATVVALCPMTGNAVTLPHVFGDNMVLQRGTRVPVWGKAKPDERVRVEFAGQSVETVASQDGRWHVALEPMEASAAGRVFKVRGEDEVAFTNVVVGEVWFCSGQSNMEFTMSARRKVKDWEKEVAAAKWPLIRHFHPPHRVAYEPMDDVEAAWVETTPETIPPQSAVAFFFGETLHKELNVPVGLINCSWGGSRIEPWTPAGHHDDLWLLQNIQTYNRAFDTPTVLWNGMVAGIAPFAIKGSIWYQGCANRSDGAKYLDKTVSLVRGWRREWGQGDFPYFLVQLAPYKYGNAKGLQLAKLQIVQSKIPDVVANSGYAVINDLGNVNDIHPIDKRPVGERLAYQVLDRVYGKFIKPWKSPVAASAEADGSGAVRIAFNNADGLKTHDGLAPTEFEISDYSGSWMPASARIDGREVVLSAEGVKKPLAVRFAPYNASTPNLVNGAGLPAGPFTMMLQGAKSELLHLSHVHRGGGKLERPDNTLETFKWCWQNGSALECDCRKTKDGVGIMLHDKTLKRTARGISPEMASRPVSKALTWDEIKDVDVGSYLDPKFSHHRIPTIEATFAAMRGHPTWLCFVDEKGAGPEYIAKRAVEAGVQDQIYYTGPSHEKIFEWNKVLPGGKSLLWLGAWPKNHGAAERKRTDKWFRDAMAKLREKDFKYISCISIHSYYDPTDPVDPFVPSTKVLKDMVEEFHAHGIPVCSIPFQGGETEEVYFKLFDLGFDGLSTDYPSVMFSVIRKLKAGAR